MRLLRRRLESLRLPPEAELALAWGDVLNHMPTLAVVTRVLRQVRRALAPGGALVFDALTDFCFETYWPDNTHRLEGPHGDLLMDCDWDPVRRRGRLRAGWRLPWSAWPDQREEPAMDRNLWCGRTAGDAAGVRPARLRALGFRRVG